MTMLAVAALLALVGVAAAAQPSDREPLPVHSEEFTGDKASTFSDPRTLAPAEKQTVLAHKKAIKPPPPEPPEVWESGISEDDEIPLSSMLVSVSNRWQRDIDQTHYAVYAGSSGTETRGPKRALVVRHLVSYDFAQEDMAIVEAKGVTGSLRVEKELDGPILRLRSEDGQAFYFDPLKAEFIARPR